jgi:hypothetical protein
MISNATERSITSLDSHYLWHSKSQRMRLSYEEAEDTPRFFFTRRKIGKEMSCNATENMTTAAIDLP